jgi:two-component system chemotaxis sensor kinase CheA
MSAQEVILVDAGQVLALPLASVRETLRVGVDGITLGPHGEALAHRGRSIPFLPLAAALGDGSCTSRSHPVWSVMLVEGATGVAAVGVPRLVGTARIAIRPLPDLAPVSPVVSGAWLDAHGIPRLVLDPDAVVSAAAQHRSITATVPTARPTILVVDDSLTTRMLEQSILVSAGYQVEVAASGEEGLAMATRKSYSLALVDVEMPGMDGFAFVEQTRVRAELRHLPCILVTSRASPEDQRRGAPAGARAHIDKGEFHEATLLAHISELIAG